MSRWGWKLFRGAVLVLTALLLLFLLFRSRFRDPILELAQTQVRNTTSDIINEAVTRELENGTVAFDRLVYFEKDLSGRITALKTNMSEINRLKTQVLDQVNTRILGTDSARLGIPLGSLVLPELFAGHGPVIPVEILAIRNSDASFESRFTEAGINQTLQQLMMEVRVDVTVLVLGQTDAFAVTTQVVAAETVLVGEVPQTYLQTGG